MTDTGGPHLDPYARIAELYDLEHDDVLDDAEFYAAVADQIDGPILELGCGSGRLLHHLAQAGHTVTGLDRSATMLDRAHQRLSRDSLNERVTLLEADMNAARRAPGGPFDLALFSLNALMHLESPERQLDALTSARDAMLKDGQVFVDVLNPSPQYLVDLGRAPILEWSSPLADGATVDKWSVRLIDSVEQTIHTTLWYDQVADSGALSRIRTVFTLRYIHPHELVLMLERAGFENAQLFGSLDLDPLTDAADRILACARVPS